MSTRLKAVRTRTGADCPGIDTHLIGDAMKRVPMEEGGVRWYYADGCEFDVQVEEVKAKYSVKTHNRHDGSKLHDCARCDSCRRYFLCAYGPEAHGPECLYVQKEGAA